MELGSVAELTSAVATTGALVAAALAAKAALATNRQQSAQLRRMEEQQAERRAAVEQEAAAQVAVWVRVDREGKPVLRYVNAGALPIYAVDIQVATPTAVFRLDYTVIGPSATRTLVNGTELLRAGAERSGLRYAWHRLLGRDELACATTFRDAAGRWWLRDFAGMLARHENQDAATAAAEAGVRERCPGAVEVRLRCEPQR